MERTAADPVNQIEEVDRLREFEELFDFSNLTAPVYDPLNISPTALTLDNSFKGVIVNPITCLNDELALELLDIRDAINGLDNTGEVFGTTADFDKFLADMDADITEIEQNMPRIQAHTDRLSHNLPSLLGIVQAALALGGALALLSNPCLGRDGFIGSIGREGGRVLREAIAAIRRAKAAITGAIGAVLGAVRDAIAAAKAEISKFISQITREIGNFARALLRQVRQGLADLLASIANDPCLKAILGTVVPAGAAVILR